MRWVTIGARGVASLSLFVGVQRDGRRDRGENEVACVSAIAGVPPGRRRVVVSATGFAEAKASKQDTVLPSWITPELIEDTIRVWQPYYAEPLTQQDAIAILQNVGKLFDVLEGPQ